MGSNGAVLPGPEATFGFVRRSKEREGTVSLVRKAVTQRGPGRASPVVGRRLPSQPTAVRMLRERHQQITSVWADRGYVSAAREAAFSRPGKFWGVMRTRRRFGALVREISLAIAWSLQHTARTLETDAAQNPGVSDDLLDRIDRAGREAEAI